MTIDDVRRAYPGLGLALYALEPGDVTLEIVTAEGEMFSFTGSTEAAAVLAAFPELAPPAAASAFD